MASVQQLEKLHHIQRLFYTGDSLEAAVAGERVAQIISRTEQLIKQRTFLRDERRRLRISTEALEERKVALKIIKRNDWIPPSITELNTKKAKQIRINIAGLMFEAPVYILQRDPKSLLAQLCDNNPPILPDKDGFFYFNRDWWLFRYIMTFMRDGTLPDDRNLLAQLFREASFWNLHELQRAIEEEKLHLRSTLSVGIVSADAAKKDKELWWRKLPSWWNAVDEAAKKEKEEKEAIKKKEDWWTDSAYKGKTFLPLSTAPDKVTTKPGEKDCKVTQSTLTFSTNNSDGKSDNLLSNTMEYMYSDYGGGQSNDYYPSTSSPQHMRYSSPFSQSTAPQDPRHRPYYSTRGVAPPLPAPLYAGLYFQGSSNESVAVGEASSSAVVKASTEQPLTLGQQMRMEAELNLKNDILY